MIKGTVDVISNDLDVKSLIQIGSLQTLASNYKCSILVFVPEKKIIFIVVEFIDRINSLLFNYCYLNKC